MQESMQESMWVLMDTMSNTARLRPGCDQHVRPHRGMSEWPSSKAKLYNPRLDS